jgi:hypothetical protein
MCVLQQARFFFLTVVERRGEQPFIVVQNGVRLVQVICCFRPILARATSVESGGLAAMQVMLGKGRSNPYREIVASLVLQHGLDSVVVCSHRCRA